MATTTDNTGNVPWKPLVSTRWDLDMRGYVTRTDQQVPHRREATEIVYTVTEAVTENERDVHKTRKITETLVPTTVVDKTLGMAWRELERFASSWTHTKQTVEESSLPLPALPIDVFHTVVVENAEHNPANFKLDIITVSGWEERTRREYDDELGVEVTITEKVVANNPTGNPSLAATGVPPTLPAPTATAWGELREVDFWRSIQTSYSVPAGFAKVWYDTIQYTFPAVFGGLTYLTMFEDSNERTVWSITPLVKPAYTVPLQHVIYEEFVTAAQVATLTAATENTSPFGTTTVFPTTTVPPAADLGTAALRARLFNPKPKDIDYNGLQVSLHVPNVLCDAMSFTFTTASTDTYYGPGKAETVTVPVTNISATTMLALTATPGKVICIEDTITSWKHGMFKRRRGFIRVQAYE